jgi:S1-C subfamily serine protease
MEQRIATGEVKRGYLGASLGTVTAENAERLALKEPVGAFVDAVVDGGPGARAGLRPNDVIVEVNGRPIKDRPDAINTIASIAPGQTIAVKVSRKGEPVEVRVTLDKRPGRPRQ